ncbi:MAG: hypothetical protein F6K61_01035 [Sphaerospermopsis sp. SIO1G1]|nr:hypothetical protein [Sphaerospermopsis sp. SIO1G1]
MLNLNKMSVKLLGKVFLTATFLYSLQSIFGSVVIAGELRGNTSTCTRNVMAQANSVNSSEQEEQLVNCEQIRNINIFLRSALSGSGDPLLSGGGSSNTQVNSNVNRTITNVEVVPAMDADATLQIGAFTSNNDIITNTITPINVVGQLNAQGNFSFNVINANVINNPTLQAEIQMTNFPFTFNIGRSNISANQALNVRSNLVQAILSSPEVNAAVQQRFQGALSIEEFAAIIVNAELTPENVPTNEMLVITGPGGVMSGSIPDR